jgi:hypothetical protein
MRKLILTAVVLASAATSASAAGPIRNAVARLTGRGCGGCGGCQPAAQAVRYAPPQYTPSAPPPVTMPATGQSVQLVSYQRGADAGPVAAPGYTPIRVSGALPTACAPLGCGR